jgi:twitching motility two-component system response regulator PilH
MAFELFKRLFGGGSDDRRRAPRVSARQGMRVLVIDDSATIVAVLNKMLRQNGYEVLKAVDGESGVELARAEKPDLIFLDIVLPGINGFAALRMLRRDPVTQKTPVIMISGNMQATEQFYAQRIGADDFMKKPFGRGEVFTRIHKLVEAGRLPQHDANAPAPAPVDEQPDVPDIAMPDPRDIEAAKNNPSAGIPSTVSQDIPSFAAPAGTYREP